MHAPTQDILIYGAGGNVEKWLDALDGSPLRVTQLIDRYTAKTSVRGIAVRRPDDDIDRSLPVYVSVSGASTAIARELRDAGHVTVYDFNQSVAEIPRLIGEFLPAMPWYGNAPDGLVNESEVSALEPRLADGTSVEVLRRLCDFRRHLDAAHYLPNDGQLQYFPDDVPWSEGMDELRFVDCGAFTGDTLEVVMDVARARDLPVRSVCLFEPEAHNLAGLNRTVAKHVAASTDLVVLPCGVWSESAVMQITEDNASSTLVALHGADGAASSLSTIATVRIDQAAYGMRPNYIKMDIEGAERQALAGAEAVIRDFHPLLAICVYHRADDVWEIPQKIEAIRPDYDFYLRSHGDTGLETVLYAVPRRAQ